MALMLKRLYNGYFWIFYEVADPRPVDLGLFMMSSPLIPAAISAAYLYFCLNLGPKLMENRKPFNLRKTIILYNIIQIIFNIKITYESFVEVFFYSNWDCYPINYGNDPRTLHIVRMYHFFWITKLSDLLDTVFFVLRKKNNQLSFLHIYHHWGMFVLIWLTVKFFAGGHGVWVGLFNGFVHIVMYTYYMLTALDESWKRSIRFKKFITQIQLVQFATFILIFGRLMFKPDCTYPKMCCYCFVPQNIFMFALFADFYRKAYLKKST